MQDIDQAIRSAECLLPGVPAPPGETDPRWRAIIDISEHIESTPEPVWQLVIRWSGQADDDLRAALATCLLEHILEHHFEVYFPQLEKLVAEDNGLAETFAICSKFRRSAEPLNAARFDSLKAGARVRASSQQCLGPN